MKNKQIQNKAEAQQKAEKKKHGESTANQDEERTIAKVNKVSGIRKREIHPALDFTEDNAFVGQEVKDALGTARNQFIIRDDGAKIPCKIPNLNEANIRLIHQECSYYPKWSENSIDDFVNGKIRSLAPLDLFNKVKTHLQKYMQFMNDGYYSYLAVWTIGTYFYPMFNSYPYVYLNGPSQSGKTKLLTLCSILSFNGQNSLHMNAAPVFRMVDNSRCCLFIDEREELNEKSCNTELRTMLLGGYKKCGTVTRMEKDSQGNFKPKSFTAYSPKMLANIAGIDSVLESRCVTLYMRKGSKKDVINKEVLEDNPLLGQTRDLAFIFMMNNWKAVRSEYFSYTAEDGISARELELWKPIFALAKHIGSNVLEEMQSLAKEVSEERRTNSAEEHENVLLKSLLSVVTKTDYYSLKEIKDEFATRVESGNWLTEQYIGSLLRRFGFRNRRRKSTGYVYLIESEKVKTLAKVYDVAIDPELEVSVNSESSEPLSENSITTSHQGENVK